MKEHAKRVTRDETTKTRSSDTIEANIQKPLGTLHNYGHIQIKNRIAVGKCVYWGKIKCFMTFSFLSDTDTKNMVTQLQCGLWFNNAEHYSFY